MKKIYIIATSNSTWPSRIFRIATREKYAHISIALDKKWKKVYSFGRKKLRWPLPGGFVIEDFDAICNFFKYSYCRVYELEITAQQLYSLKTELKNNYIKNNDKYHYNLIGLPMVGINRAHHRKYHHTCSSFCAKVLIDTGIVNFKKDYSIIKPKDFFEIKNANLIYEGETLDFLKRNQ